MTKRIYLTQGKFTIVDDEDFQRLSRFKWHAQVRPYTSYAVREFSTGYGRRRRKLIPLHRFILDAPDGIQVDHINGNGLDNRRVNLRLCTAQQNCANNRRVYSKSGYKGVYWNQCVWQARLNHNGKLLYFGSYKSPIDAARAYDKAATEIFGSFARTNEGLGLIKEQ